MKHLIKFNEYKKEEGDPRIERLSKSLHDEILELIEDEKIKESKEDVSFSGKIDKMVKRFSSKLPWALICSIVLSACSQKGVTPPSKYKKGCNQPAKFSNFSAGFKPKNVSKSSEKRLKNYKK